jgi:hypothetical protein
MLAKPLILGLVLLASALATQAADSWKPLWNGKDLQGWHVIGKGQWTIKDGAIHGTNVQTEKDFGHLVTNRDYTNFTIRIQYKTLKGNSGLYFRVAEKGFSGVTGFQAEIDPDKDAGGLYETNGRGWVVQPKAEDVKTWFKPGAWNEMTVHTQGRNVTVHVNGKQSAKITNDPGPISGKFALQVHGSQDVDIWFKDIEIIEHP